jgi:hypothetical protein
VVERVDKFRYLGSIIVEYSVDGETDQDVDTRVNSVESRMFGRVSFGRGSFSRMRHLVAWSFGREVIWARGLMVVGSFGRTVK